MLLLVHQPLSPATFPYSALEQTGAAQNSGREYRLRLKRPPWAASLPLRSGGKPRRLEQYPERVAKKLDKTTHRFCGLLAVFQGGSEGPISEFIRLE
jgi:hypothetical protein